jgi:CRP-like cAMP-binding protein
MSESSRKADASSRGTSTPTVRAGHDSPAPYRNRLLAMLPADELALLAPHLEPLKLERRQLLYDTEAPIQHVHFVEHGIASILSVLEDGSAVETATIGLEGMIGMPVFHGVDVTVEQAMIQVPGDGYRLSAETFRALIPRLPTLTALLHRFAVFQFTLAAQNSGCNRKHAVEQRCARWLLIVRDRLDTDDLGLTHDFISQMLGVRRASVTDTLASLEARGLIRTGRSRITVTDRRGLETIACECYRIITSASERLIERKPALSPLATVETSRDGFSTVGDGTPIAESLDEPG